MEQKKIKCSRPYHHGHQNKKDCVEKRNAYEKKEAKQSLESLLIFKRACFEDSCLEDSRAKDFFSKVQRHYKEAQCISETWDE